MADSEENNYQDYFAALLDLMKKRRIGLRTPLKVYSGQFQVVDRWPGPIHSAVNILKSTKEIRVDVTLKGEKAHEHFLQLKRDQHAIEEIIGKVDWDHQNHPRKRDGLRRRCREIHLTKVIGRGSMRGLLPD
jgi:hypothetical protein